MFKYLPSLKRISNNPSITSLIKINTRYHNNFLTVSFNAVRKFNFSSDGKSQKKELSFFERLKEKFTVKESEKIDHSKLQKRNEEEDSQLHSTKIENDIIFTEEERMNLQKLMEQETEETENTGIDKINTDIEIPLSEIREGIFDKSETFEILISKLNLKMYEANLSIRRQYNNLKYDEDIKPRVDELLKIGFDQSQVKVIIQK